MLTPPDQSTRKPLFDADAIAAELEELVPHYEGQKELRIAVAMRLKRALADARKAAEANLLKDRLGLRCAADLCLVQDQIIRVLFQFATKHLYAAESRSEAERMAVVATGGYGRGLMAPGSDIDLLFVLPYKQTAWGELIAEAILYCLWDMGLKVGHATRSVDECIRQAKADMTIRTAILEARYLLGDRELYDELVTRFDKQIAQGTAREFVTAKLAERDERHRRAGMSRYLVEPNVKDGKGGLRDLHTLFWIAKYVYRVREPQELVERHVFDQREFQIFQRCENFLWAVRCNMHFVAGRAEERLSFDIQRDIAVRLGYSARPGLQDVERFMKHYFLIAKDVGDLTAILCAGLESRQAMPVPVLNRMVAKLRPRPRAQQLPGNAFFDDYNRINIISDKVFERDPVNLIRIFHIALKHKLAFHPDAMRAAARSLRLIDKSVRERRGSQSPVSGNPDGARRRRGRAAAHERGRRAGHVHPRLRPRRVDDAVQHVSSLHGRRASAALRRRAGRDRGRHQSGIRTRQRPHAQHSAASSRSALRRAVSARHRQGPDRGSFNRRCAHRATARTALRARAGETETVAWLIENHLVMSTIAQSRDLSDRKTVENFSPVVQSLERMKLLTILTTADIRAVGPGVWNSWKAQLIRALYYETEPALTGGFSEVDRARRVALAQAEFRAELKDWPAAGTRPLHLTALLGLLAQGRPAGEARARALRALGRGSRQEARDLGRLRYGARRHRADRARARPPVAAIGHRRCLRHDRCQHRRRPDLHHDRRPRARHDRGVA